MQDGDGMDLITKGSHTGAGNNPERPEGAPSEKAPKAEGQVLLAILNNSLSTAVGPKL